MYTIFDWENEGKCVFHLNNNALVEAALFEHHDLIHLCVPTQVGCSMGCKHCATTYAPIPYMRNLSSTELIEMIEAIKERVQCKSSPLVLSFSGHGEPMMNWCNVHKCISNFHDSFSNIYVTSIGVIKTMNNILSDADFHPDIYFSIHGSSDKERALLIPATKNKAIANLQHIIDFGKAYTQQGGRVIWNYMICNINSSKTSLEHLLELCTHIDYPLELRFTKYIDIHEDESIYAVEDNISNLFCQRILLETKPNICVRLSKLEGEGLGIACGQMRAYIQKNKLTD